MTTRSFLAYRLPSRSGPAPTALALVIVVALALSNAGCTGNASGSPSEGTGSTGAPLPVGSPTEERPACTGVTSSDPAVAVTLFRPAPNLEEPEGCVPPERLVAWRCRRGSDPVIATGLGTSGMHLYLGGAFSVPLRRLPEQARSLGVARGAEVFGVPSDPSLLYVLEDGALVRWLSLPDPGTLVAPPDAFLVGDSILDGARYDVDEQLEGWSTTIDAEIGRPSSSGVAIAQARSLLPPTVSVVELGTNDADPISFGENAAAILDALAASPFVVWVTVHSPLDGAAEVNAEIRRSVAAAPNAVLAEWARDAPPDAFQSDGVHLLPDRTHEFADLLTPLLVEWHAAATGRGATACASQLVTG